MAVIAKVSSIATRRVEDDFVIVLEERIENTQRDGQRRKQRTKEKKKKKKKKSITVTIIPMITSTAWTWKTWW